MSDPVRLRALADRLSAGWGYHKAVTPRDIYDAITLLRTLAEEQEKEQGNPHRCPDCGMLWADCRNGRKP